MDIETAFMWCGLIAVVPPLALLAVLGLPALLRISLSESFINRSTFLATVLGLAGALGALVLMLATGDRHVPVELGNWVIIEEQQFHFHLKFVFDRLSVPFTILCYLLCGTTSVFASRYLHREEGFGRFYIS